MLPSLQLQPLFRDKLYWRIMETNVTLNDVKYFNFSAGNGSIDGPFSVSCRCRSSTPPPIPESIGLKVAESSSQGVPSGQTLFEVQVPIRKSSPRRSEALQDPRGVRSEVRSVFPLLISKVSDFNVNVVVLPFELLSPP